MLEMMLSCPSGGRSYQEGEGGGQRCEMKRRCYGLLKTASAICNRFVYRTRNVSENENCLLVCVCVFFSFVFAIFVLAKRFFVLIIKYGE